MLLLFSLELCKMSSKKKKPASGEARERLQAKLVDVKNKVHSLHETINKVSSEVRCWS